MLKANWDVYNIERTDREKWEIQLVCLSQECPSFEKDPIAYVGVTVDVAYEPEDRSVGIQGGWIAQAPPDMPKECWCGNRLPREDQVEEEIAEHVEGWAESQEDPRDEYNREDEDCDY
jgi:hypothetical protein